MLFIFASISMQSLLVLHFLSLIIEKYSSKITVYIFKTFSCYDWYAISFGKNFLNLINMELNWNPPAISLQEIKQLVN